MVNNIFEMLAATLIVHHVVEHVAGTSCPLPKVVTLPPPIFGHAPRQRSAHVAAGVGHKGWEPPSELVFLKLFYCQLGDNCNTRTQPLGIG